MSLRVGGPGIEEGLFIKLLIMIAGKKMLLCSSRSAEVSSGFPVHSKRDTPCTSEEGQRSD